MTYTAGIIGTGGIAGQGTVLGADEKETAKKVQASHAGGYETIDGIELVAAADVDEESLRQFGNLWNLSTDQLYTDHTEMLASEDLDVVSVCTPTYLHSQHTIDTVQSAADPDIVWCEKPIASGISEARSMLQACDEARTELMINHSYRFSDQAVELRRRIQEEELLGEVVSADGRFKLELLRNGTHLIDLLYFLLDTNVKAVSGFLSDEVGVTKEMVDDTAGKYDDTGGVGTLKLENGAVATVDCSAPRGLSSAISWEMLGESGYLTVELPLDSPGEIQFSPVGESGLEDSRSLQLDEQWTPVEGLFRNAVSHILGILEGSESNRSPGEEAIQALETIIALYISHYTNTHVSLPINQPLEAVHIGSW